MLEGQRTVREVTGHLPRHNRPSISLDGMEQLNRMSLITGKDKSVVLSPNCPLHRRSSSTIFASGLW
jgi:hypothetical protein